MTAPFDIELTKAYIVGGGIAGLATAAYLIRDGRLAGTNIYIFEEGAQTGGSLDAHGAPECGYVMRGGRMFDEEAYTCTFDLMSFIPSLTDPQKTLKQEFFEFNETFRSHARSRLVSNGQKVDVSSHGFSARDRLDLIELMIQPENTLGTQRIDEYFQPSFFETNFWFMWCTTFAFQPWHSAVEFKRYMLRFIQEFPRIETLAGVRRTPYNQYDAIVRPLVKWLKAQGVRFEMNSQVTTIDFKSVGNETIAKSLQYVMPEGVTADLVIGEHDFVFATLGSMTAGSTLGNMTAAPSVEAQRSDGAWALWHTIAKNRPEFGRPSVFDGHVAQSMWESFSVTFDNPMFFRMMKEFTGNEAGTGGLVTFKDSNWLMSVVLPHQPHFLNQPENVYVCWGYALFPNAEGNYVKKKMAACSGEEILTELFSHLRFDTHAPELLKTANCIPCMMPYITSQFLVRAEGDRPAVVPKGARNFAFLGQYCEIADDVVFTVEYSVRSAQIAVFALLDLDKKVSTIYKGQYDPSVLFNSVKAMLK